MTDNALQSNRAIVQLRYDGLSFLVGNPAKKWVAAFYDKSWDGTFSPEILLKNVQDFLVEKDLNLKDADSVLWLFSSSKFTLIPDHLYDEEKQAAFLENTTFLEASEIVKTDFWIKREIACVFAFPRDLHDFIIAQNDKSQISHSSFSFNALHKEISLKKDFSFLNISENFAELYLTQKSTLIFYNQFEWNSPEDLLYYILFALEQNGILAPEVELRTAGKIEKGDSLQRLLEKYIGKVESIGLLAGIRSESQITRRELRNAAPLISVL